MKRYVAEFAADELEKLETINPNNKEQISQRIKYIVAMCRENVIDDYEAVVKISESYTYKGENNDEKQTGIYISDDIIEEAMAECEAIL